MTKYVYRIEQPHREYNSEELRSERDFRENQQHSDELQNSLANAGFSFVVEAYVSVSVCYYEIMVTTDRKISDEELDGLLRHFSKDTVCTDKWSYERTEPCKMNTDKTMSEQFEDIKIDMCNNYCKYHESTNKEEDTGKSNDICDNCPLGRL